MKINVSTFKIISLISFITGVSSFASAQNLGSVNGKNITAKEFSEAISRLGSQADAVRNNPMYRQKFFDHYVNTMLLASEAEKASVDKSTQFKDRMSDVRRDLLAQTYADQVVEKNVTDASLKSYFDAHKSEFSNKQVKASHILIESEDEAKKVFEEVKKTPANFATLAQKHSKDPGSKNNGGELGSFTRGRMVPEFEAAAFSTPKGEIHPKLVKTQFGYHIIKVQDIQGDDNVKFEAVKDQVAEKVKVQSQENLLKELREKNKVSVDEKLIRESKL